MGREFTEEEIKLLEINGFSLKSDSIHYQKTDDDNVNTDYIIILHDLTFLIETYWWNFDEETGYFQDFSKNYSLDGETLETFLNKTYATKI